MGTGFDCFHELSHTLNPKIGDQQRANRLLLKALMEKYGFRNYDREWWALHIGKGTLSRDLFRLSHGIKIVTNLPGKHTEKSLTPIHAAGRLMACSAGAGHRHRHRPLAHGYVVSPVSACLFGRFHYFPLRSDQGTGGPAASPCRWSFGRGARRHPLLSGIRRGTLGCTCLQLF